MSEDEIEAADRQLARRMGNMFDYLRQTSGLPREVCTKLVAAAFEGSATPVILTYGDGEDLPEA